jgi:methylthioribose-1-phosphate isomerase
MIHTLPKTITWRGGVDGHLVLLDQTRLPAETVYLDCRTVEDVWQAIKRLSVRGAPAIGVAAAYGVCLGVQNVGWAPPTTGRDHSEGGQCPPYEAPTRGPSEKVECPLSCVDEVCDYLATSRPTAVNLFWALERMRRVASRVLLPLPPGEGRGEGALSEVKTPSPCPLPKGEGSRAAASLAESLLAEARAIHEEDRQMCAAIGRHGADLLADLPEGAGILTHCNAGALATGGEGTALAVIFELARRGRRPHVWVDETRPLLQGARLTAWELRERGIDATLICDSAAAQVMREGRVQAVITGADRIAANGDVANKVGTLGVATLANVNRIPFYMAAPTSTFDLSIASGDEIPIEQRAAEEVTHGFGRQTAPDGIDVYNPAFDVTPAELVVAIITERGVIRPVNARTVRAVNST